MNYICIRCGLSSNRTKVDLYDLINLSKKQIAFLQDNSYKNAT